MRIVIILLLLFVSYGSLGQTEGLAKNYFEQGKYEKALTIFKKLVKQNPGNNSQFLYLIKTYQQLERYDEAQVAIMEKLNGRRQYPQYYVELGHNYTLQDKDSLANFAYQKAIKSVEENPIYAYIVGRTLSDYSRLDEAATVYERAMELDPERDYNSQLARIYGEQGKLELMFEKYIDLIQSNVAYRPSAQRNFSFYINEDPTNEANIVFKKALLKRLQGNPDILYNELLSWLFIQQKDYRKAFTQEKAIYKRSGGDLSGIIDLLRISMEEESYEDAKQVAEFVIENAPTIGGKISGYQYLMNIELELATEEDYAAIQQKYLGLFERFGGGSETYALQLDYNEFLAFKFGKKEEAIDNLKTLSKKRLSIYQEARIKLILADILVFDEKFNQALIYYSQVQKKVKNDRLAQEARFKVARTSYYKGDFEWSLVQLDVLKKSASQLIANDAMELALMIRDNSLEDSTQTALKKFAKADLLVLQNRYSEANALFNDILENHKGEAVEDETLLKQGFVYETLNDFAKAEANYEKIIEFYNDDILADDAHFRLAKLYEEKLDMPQKAKDLYEQIIFNFADSIFFVEARKRYRMLRGDEIN
ncbi:tetratricopeptide repeat protein [Aureisphaera galaxeae]|uniref:tetratricopeptide repeat protein n=1 Tax=Aureisphaera galaxeae TaxID=1538023 RepID=UPI0023507430|nr:tetratricopeptide repeat protein [Aureisphaera galaxeae]MDC8005972.1 tetratricopeptide repeat protein [Aureisphaera galaxeae]